MHPNSQTLLEVHIFCYQDRKIKKISRIYTLLQPKIPFKL